MNTGPGRPEEPRLLAGLLAECAHRIHVRASAVGC
jgi:hypothetical protein